MKKVSELEGAELDYWVAKAIKHRVANVTKDEFIRCYWQDYMPSTYWSQGGPIIERERIELQFSMCCWMANLYPSDGDDGSTGNYLWSGPTPLVAAMRAFVASKFGDEVE